MRLFLAFHKLNPFGLLQALTTEFYSKENTKHFKLHAVSASGKKKLHKYYKVTNKTKVNITQCTTIQQLEVYTELIFTLHIWPSWQPHELTK